MRKVLGIAAALAMAAVPALAEGPSYKVSGAAWTDFGRIGQVSDTILYGPAPSPTLDISGNVIVSPGAQFTIDADLSDHWEAAFGFGAHKVNHAMGHGNMAFLTISMYQMFLTESRLTWFAGEKQDPSFSVTVGSFPYKYNPDVNNLGLYLFRGPVYPGILMGGFQDFAVDPTKATQLGARVHHSMGILSQDLILNTERDLPPTFDWSLGYVAKLKLFGALDLGAGVNFYRLFAYDEDLRTPGKLSDSTLGFKKAQYIEVNPLNPADTTFFTHQGTKVMAMATLDLKPLFGLGSMGKDDLKLYTEAAVIGLKDYGTTYGDIMQRIPVMFGVNLPTFGLFDRINIEVEQYKSPHRNDLGRLGNNNVVADWTTQTKPIPSPKPVDNADFTIKPDGTWTNAYSQTINVEGTALDKEDIHTDDLKWSLAVDKTIASHIRFTAQVANDHYRPRPLATGLIAASGGTAEAFSDKSNWYFMLRMGYFF